MKYFTSVHDIGNLQEAISEARSLKNNPFAYEHLGKKKILGLVFFNPSLRTRMSTQKAAFHLGLDCMILNAFNDSWTIETKDGIVMDGKAGEHIKEAVPVIAQYCDIIGIRAFASLQDRDEDYQEILLNSFKKYCDSPIISLESSIRHPLQSFADIITIEEQKIVKKPKIVLTWAPHPKALPQAVPNSFTEWMKKASVELDYEFTITHPKGYDLADEFYSNCTIIHNQDEALQGADFVYAKNWSSYTEYGQILSKDTSWTINTHKMALTNSAKFMHCLPVRRNMIVTDDILDSSQSIVIQQAKNRIYSAQTVLKRILESM